MDPTQFHQIQTGRPVTLGTRGMVTSPHSLASAAGCDVLRAGGSAIDAAIATAAVLAVVYPHMTGVGGDAFWLIHGGGKAAAASTLAAMEQRRLKEIPLQGIVPATLTVPGSVASWIAAHEAHGRLAALLPRCRASWRRIRSRVHQVDGLVFTGRHSAAVNSASRM